MSDCFATDHELSGTNVNRLWEGVSFVMQDRAAQAKSWGCPEVDLCHQLRLNRASASNQPSPPPADLLACTNLLLLRCPRKPPSASSA